MAVLDLMEESKSLLVPWISLGVLVILLGVIVGGAEVPAERKIGPAKSLSVYGRSEKGDTLPIVWGDLGAKLVESGVIDGKAFEELYATRGGLSAEERALVYGKDNGKLLMNEENADVILNLLWAFGLANKSPVLEKGEMANPQYPTDEYASTGGWTLARSTSSGQAQGDAMDHYAKHALVALTPAQEALVDEVSRNIYRPCCDNSTHFPDCNHGMAMLALLEILAAQGASKEEMYAAALVANSYWFPDTYDMIGEYARVMRIKVTPQLALSKEFSSASGFRKVAEKIQGPQSGGSCSA